MTLRVLVTGAAGLVGRALRLHAPGDVEVLAADRHALDIRDTAACERMLSDHRPHWVLNPAAFTDVDGAERDPASALDVNARAVGALALLCRRMDSGLLHFSTDYVFDGAREGYYGEHDTPNPLSVYGRTKLAGEEEVRRSGCRHLIVRTSWVYGDEGRNFLSSLPQRARRGQPTRVVADQTSCTTYAPDLAAACWSLIQTRPRSLRGGEATYHIANRGKVDRFAFANAIFAKFDATEALTRITMLQANDLALRPRNSALDVSAVEHLLGRTLPSWQDALGRYLG